MCHEQWSRLFGHAIEKLGISYLRDAFSPELIYTEEDIKAWGSVCQCDAIVGNSELIALDFVYRQFTRPTAGTGTFADLVRDLQMAVVEKVKQIDTSIACGISKSVLSPESAVYPLVVIGGPFPIVPLLYAEITKLLLGQPLSYVGKNPNCRPLSIVNIAEFKRLLQTASMNNCTAQSILELWLDSPLARNSLGDWLSSDVTKP